MRNSWLSLALCLPLLGCETTSVATPSRGLAPVASSDSGIQASPTPVRAPTPLPAPRSAVRERCPDEFLPRGREVDLEVRVEDVRAERRVLLPLDLSMALRAEPSERSASRRYLAELLIDGYSAPRLFRRLNAPRSEWAAGSLQGRLVVHDLTARSVLCQVPLRVRGDATGAPISRRLRESTRQGLDRKLYARTRDAMESALGSISSVLRLARGSAAEASARGS